MPVWLPDQRRALSHLARETWYRAAVWVRCRAAAGVRGWLTLALAAMLPLGAMLAADVVLFTPSVDRIAAPDRLPEASTVFDVHGKIAFTIARERRILVPLDRIAPALVQAVLAVEDQRFFEHDGIDFWRVGGAALANLRGGRLQGASTITMQLARKSFLTDERTILRKLEEAYLALRIERRFSKDRTLELYLNKVYFGNGLYGVEAAALGYFGKSASALSVDEAALLAGLIQAPSAYDPTDHLDRALARRRIVLQQMAAGGVIEAEEIETLARRPVHLESAFGDEHSGLYFKSEIERLLVQQFGAERVSEGGLRVYSTIDLRLQAAAEDALERGLVAIESRRGFRHPRRHDDDVATDADASAYLQGALVAIDPASGDVRALIGGRDFGDSQFDRATQASRQAGSAFKPFVYAAAIESGDTPSTLVTGLDDPMLASGRAWLPTDGHDAGDAMTMRTALRISSNRAAVQVLRTVGIPRAVRYAAKLGLDVPAVPSLVLGSGEVTPLAMAAAYGVFANGGWLRQPILVRRVEDATGEVLLEQQPRSTRALSADTAFLMADMLADVVNSGTGYRARDSGFYGAAGGKTGTTDDYRDAWFVGFTPALVTSVWIGFDTPRTIVAGGFAGDLAAPIWGRFMRRAGRADAGWVTRPDDIVGVEVCEVSGLLPTPGCRRTGVLDEDSGLFSIRSFVHTEYFRRGSEPTAYCPVHGWHARR